MPRLVIGPLLRHVGETDATVWVETDGPCTVSVLGHSERTWCMAGHHYALVCIQGLTPGTSTPYDVRLDDDVVWPPPDSQRPPSRIRTLAADRALRVLFGSCRYARPEAVREDRHLGTDALAAYAQRLPSWPDDRWPDALVLLGDQVYADETTPATQRRIRARRDPGTPPGLEVADFEEYTWLYAESWSDPDVRWLLSTVPSSMIFDDHDVRDDWNTSHLWREEMLATSWWQERIIGALSSYWVYQHLGNLSPDGLDDDPLYQKVRDHQGDVEPLLRDFAIAADQEADGAKGTQWSYRRDLAGVRLLVIDSRCGRMLSDNARSMVSEAEFRWIEQAVEGSYDHLLVGTSLPWLLPRALHDVESWNERLCAGSRGPRVARWSEQLRRLADLEHWASFRTSFDRLAVLLARVARGAHPGAGGQAPGSVSVLSGDVHHAYAARVRTREPHASPIYQLTCSPLHNYVPLAMKAAFRLSWSRAAEKTTRFLLNRVSRVPHQPVDWDRVEGPYFGPAIATLTLDGRRALLVVEGAQRDADDRPQLRPVFDRILA